MVEWRIRIAAFLRRHKETADTVVSGTNSRRTFIKIERDFSKTTTG
jgi:hypothetical protein